VTAVAVYRSKKSFEKKVRLLLTVSIGATVFAELSFTFYLRSDGFFNFLGHLLKIGSFWLIYLALIAGEVKNRINTIEELRRARRKIEKSEMSLLRSNAAKDKFISIMAHDLRNPFSGVLTLTELITKRFDSMTSEEIKRQVEMAYSGTRQGMELLDHLVAWGKAQAGRVDWQPTPVNLKSLAEMDIEFVEAAAERKRITIENSVEDAITVFGDPNMLSTVIRNLLNNAIKYSDKDAIIEIASARENGKAVVAIKDTGLGMDEESRQKLFRIDTHFSTIGTDGERGNGLGLLLCRELVSKNKGEIWVESVPGKGSTFFFTVPLNE
jgi:signal transduction histidine kinase